MTLPLATLLVVASASVAVAQDTHQPAYAVDVVAGNVTGDVSLTGAVIVSIDDEEYWFSDGTDIIKIDIDVTWFGPPVPLLTLMTIEGTTKDDEINVSSWAPVDLMMATVIRTAEEAAEAFQAWVVTQNSQAPSE
jgi:uncharacterized protein YdeI (BOF family)